MEKKKRELKIVIHCDTDALSKKELQKAFDAMINCVTRELSLKGDVTLIKKGGVEMPPKSKKSKKAKKSPTYNDLPGMPKIDKCAEMALNVLEAKADAALAKENLEDAQDVFSEHMLANKKETVRVTYRDNIYEVGIKHVEAKDKVEIKKY